MSIRERERSGHFVCRGFDKKRREEKKERDCEEVRSRNFVTSFTKYNKDKVPVDVATSLVVNHVKYWCIVFDYVMFILKSMVK